MVTQSLVQGRAGEARTKLAESLFLDSHEYHTFNNILIRTGLKTTQIDHVIVSRYGVFVIETKNKNGWIFGSRWDRNWTQIIYNKKYKFQNPLKQNFLHTQSLAKRLQLSHDKLHSIIVFWGNCEFRTTMPDNVLNNKLTGYLKSKQEVLFTYLEVESICRQLTEIKESTTARDVRSHVIALRKRFGKN
jgi:restriction system protein